MFDDHKEWNEVEVDQPALVNKILSHYSGPFDVFRELIQNADDANAKKVEICFLTEDSCDKFGDTGVSRISKWVIRDDGDGLDSDDKWRRLRTIASGNEDPAKVGTFGVGFYTVLGVCSQPLLRSKGQVVKMQMSQGDKLRVKLPESCEDDGWTTIELVLKKELKERLPNMSDLARFLISSITFLEKVNTITVFLGNQTPEVLHIQKKLESGPELPVEIPAIPSSPGIMTIKSVDFTTQHVTVRTTGKEFLMEPKTRPAKKNYRFRNSALSDAPNQVTVSPPGETKMDTVASYCLYTAQVEAHPPMKMKEEIKSIMKRLPDEFSCKAVYFNVRQWEEINGSSTRHLFEGLDGILPKTGGHIFTGQCTKEPTGIGLHVAAKHIILDVVRSSVRFGYSQVDEWNKSLLNTAGQLARAIYDHEMKIASTSGPTKLKELGLHTMRRFAFDRDLATSQTSLHFKTGFFSAPNQNVLCNSGICDVSRVRRYDKDLHSILKNIPYLHAELSQEQRKLIEEKCLDIGRDDMIAAFASCCLSEENIESFFGWFENATNKGILEADEEGEKDFFDELRRKGRLQCEECGVIELKEIKRYTQLTHHKELLPPKTIYIRQAQNYVKYLDMLRWKPLDPICWLRFVLGHADPEKAFDSRILTALASIPATSTVIWKQAEVLLSSFECISTNYGLKKPCDSYLRIAGIWSDVSIANVDRLLTDDVYERLGVRSRLDWDGLLNRLEASAATYTNDRFLPYLADMVAKNHLSNEQIEDLKKRKALDSETHGKLPTIALHRLDKLGNKLRELGLPILALRGMDGVQTDFLTKLGVRLYPPLEVIDRWLATSDDTKVSFAVRCLRENSAGYREEVKQLGVALIPTKSGALAHLDEVFSCSDWEELGFHIISDSLAEYADVLGLEKNPRPERLIEGLKNGTKCEKTARVWFKQLSQCVYDFKKKESDELKHVPFIPFGDRHLLSATPKCLKECFVMSSLPGDKSHLKEILPFIDFGEDGDNLLMACTSRVEPPKASDVARAMVACPQGFLDRAGVERYKNELCDIAKEFDSFSEELRNAMRTSPILLARRRVQDGSYEEQLKPACEIQIGGDKENLRDFGQSVFVAPDDLKTLYEKLGSKPLDSCVVYHVYPTGTETTFHLEFDHNDVLQCARIFKDEEPTQEWQFDIFSRNVFVKTCRKIELVKELDYSKLGIVPKSEPTSVSREVAAGLREDSEDLITLWVVKDPEDMYFNDIATALCRKLLPAYSRRDVRAMKLLLVDKKSRDVAQDDKTKADVQTTVYDDRLGTSVQGRPHTRSNNPTAVRSPVARWYAWPNLRLPYKGEGRAVVSKLDPMELAKQAIAISSAPRQANSSEASRRSFMDVVTGPRRKDVHCKQIDTNLEVDERFKRYDISFYMATQSRQRDGLEGVVEMFAKLAVNLAHVFGVDPRETCRIFWKDTDCDLMAFNRQQRYIYLNLAHYSKYHYGPQADRGCAIMDWYLIFAHEIAHNLSPQHDKVHETAFVGLCMSRLDALRARFQSHSLFTLISSDSQ